MLVLTSISCRRIAAFLILIAAVGHATAVEIGRIKVATGNVSVERNGQPVAGRVGLRLEPADVLKTGVDGSVGITMSDNSLLSAGPNSILSLARYDFDPTTSQGRFEAQLQRGSLTVISGRIAKQDPQAMTVRTPSAILGVRGTEFAVAVDD